MNLLKINSFVYFFNIIKILEMKENYMKKLIFAMFITGTLLAGCGEDESSKELEAIKQQYTSLETEYEKLSTNYQKLQEQYEQTTMDQDISEEQQKTSELLKERFVQIVPSTSQGPYQVIIQDSGPDSGVIYKVEQMMLSKKPNEEYNVYELAFQQLFPQLTFNEVIINDNQTITIDFNENSTGSPNLTASGQVGPFFDMLKFFLYYNFPDLKAYYLYSNRKPTRIGDSFIYTEAQPNNGPDFENLYNDIY